MKSILLLPILFFCLALNLGAQESWVAQNSGSTAGNFYGVDFVDTNTGWVIPGNKKTTDGGKTWLTQISNGDQWQGMDFVNANVGFTVGFTGSTASTIDGGQTWAVNNGAAGSKSFSACKFVSTTTGWAVGNGIGTSGYILKTTNGGSGWTTQATYPNWKILGVDFVDANTGWVVGDSGVIFNTKNGGTTWTRQTSGTTDELWSVDFIDANTGWAVGVRSTGGVNGTILKTTDGGANWIRQTSGVSYALLSVQFSDANIGWAVGEGGTILRTLNGGNSWAVQPSGVSTGLLGVRVLDATHVWAVGHSGVILKHMGTPTPIFHGETSQDGFGFSRSGQLSYRVLTSSKVTVLLFDIRGKIALKLFDGLQSAGMHVLQIPKNQISSPLFLDCHINGFRKTLSMHQMWQ